MEKLGPIQPSPESRECKDAIKPPLLNFPLACTVSTTPPGEADPLPPACGHYSVEGVGWGCYPEHFGITKLEASINV